MKYGEVCKPGQPSPVPENPVSLQFNPNSACLVLLISSSTGSLAVGRGLLCFGRDRLKTYWMAGPQEQGSATLQEAGRFKSGLPNPVPGNLMQVSIWHT